MPPSSTLQNVAGRSSVLTAQCCLSEAWSTIRSGFPLARPVTAGARPNVTARNAAADKPITMRCFMKSPPVWAGAYEGRASLSTGYHDSDEKVLLGRDARWTVSLEHRSGDSRSTRERRREEALRRQLEARLLPGIQREWRSARAR